jgi:hypothetical protein
MEYHPYGRTVVSRESWNGVTSGRERNQRDSLYGGDVSRWMKGWKEGGMRACIKIKVCAS